MPDFTDLFIQSKGQPIKYKGNIIQMIDKFPVKNGDILSIYIESSNSSDRQGLSVDITGYCEIDGITHRQGKGVNMLFWDDTSPGETKLTIFTKKDFVWVENIWEEKNHYLVSDESGNTVKKPLNTVHHGFNGAAMIVEEIETGRRYFCNDGVPDDDFDDIIFTVRNIGNIYKVETESQHTTKK